MSERKSVSALIDSIPSYYKLLVSVIALGAAFLAAARTGRAIVEVPVKLNQHIYQADTIISELREQTKVMRTQVCLTVTPKANWFHDCFNNSKTP